LALKEGGSKEGGSTTVEFLAANLSLFLQGANRVLFYHNHNIARALVELFPEIGLDEMKLRKINQGMTTKYSLLREKVKKDFK
jgi:hypothetical protein